MVKVSRKSTKSRRVTPLRKRGGSSNKFQGGGVSDAVSSVSDTKKVIKKNVTKKAITKPLAHVSKEVVKRGAPKVISKIGSRFIPGVGWVAAGADLLTLGFKEKSKAYKEMDERSPGTSKHLETGAYGQQTSDSGHKVRGTFFGSMKKRGGLIKRKYQDGGTTNEPDWSKMNINATSKNNNMPKFNPETGSPIEYEQSEAGQRNKQHIEEQQKKYREDRNLKSRVRASAKVLKPLGYIPTPVTMGIGALATAADTAVDVSEGKDAAGGIFETAASVVPGFKHAKKFKDVTKHLAKKATTKAISSKLKKGGLITKKHRKKHSAKHIRVMKEEMAKGKSFDKAHIVAIKRVGR